MNVIEEFIWRVAKLEDLESRLSILSVIHDFDEKFTSLSERLELFSDTCSSITDSRLLRQLMLTIRDIGNIMNEGSSRGDAVGFSVSSLNMLSNIRGVNGVSLLSYVADVALHQGIRPGALLRELPQLHEAVRLPSFAELIVEVQGALLQVSFSKHSLVNSPRIQEFVRKINQRVEEMSRLLQRARECYSFVKEYFLDGSLEQESATNELFESLNTYCIRMETCLREQHSSSRRYSMG